MKKVIGVLCILFIGCTQPQPPPSPSLPPPPIIKKEAAPRVVPSAAYLAGYNDGYYGTWLAPAKWTFGVEYRNGWSAGSWDRRHNKPNKYAKD